MKLGPTKLIRDGKFDLDTVFQTENKTPSLGAVIHVRVAFFLSLLCVQLLNFVSIIGRVYPLALSLLSFFCHSF
jgi:hypothetical protein